MKRLAHLIILLSAFVVSARAQINTDRMMIVGRNALYYDDYVLSIQYFNMVINAKPYLYEPYFYRGVAKFYLEDYAGAENDCSEAIRRNPYFPDSYEVRGLSRINQGNYKDAADDYFKAVEMEPNSQPLWNNLTLCLMEMNDTQKADSVADIFIGKWPKYAKGYCMKAQITLEEKDTLEAEKYIDQAIAIDPNDVSALSMKSSFLMRKEDYAGAEKVLTEAIRLQPKNLGNIINRALCRYNQRNLRGAMSDYDLALTIDPENFVGHYNRGLLRANVGDGNRAIEDFNFILEKDPSDMMVTFNRALLLHETGDYRGAIRDYTTVIKAYPNFLLGYQKRAEAKRLIGDVRGAVRDEEHVLKEEVAHRYGYASAASRKVTTRKRSERNMDDYNKLVVEDEQPEKQYKSEYRGKVQNRSTDTKLQPMYVLTYYEEENKLKQVINYCEEVDALNGKKVLPGKLILTNREKPLEEKDFTARMNSLTKLNRKSDATALTHFAKALEYYLLQDAEKAAGELDSAVNADKNFMLAYYARAVVHTKMADMAVQNPKDSKISGTAQTMPEKADIHLMMAKADMSKAIELAPDLAYAYYNRACIEAKMADYESAEADLTKCINMYDKFAEAYYNRGVMRILSRKTKEGLSDLSKAGELGLYTAYGLIKKYSKQDEK